jgi:MFS family permease
MPSSRFSARQILGGVFFVHGLMFASWAAHIPHIKAHLALSDGTLGLVLLAVPVGSISAMGAGAWLLPRVGSKRMVVACLIGYVVSGPFVGVGSSPVALFIELLCWGGFQGTLDVSMNTQAVGVEREVGQPMMSGLHGRWSLGALTGAGAGALGVWLGASLSEQLIVLGIPALLIVPLCRGLHDEDIVNRVHSDGEERAHLRLHQWPKTVILLAVIAFASMMGEGAASDWSAVYLRNSVGATAVVASLGYTAFAAAMVIIRLGADRFIIRYRAERVIPVLALTASVIFAGGLLSSSAVGGLIAFAALGAGVAAVVPLMFSAAGSIPGVPSAAGIAAVSGFGWAGFVCGPPIIGQLAQATSLPWALTIVPVLIALVAVGTRTALRPRTSQSDTDQLRQSAC